MRDRERRGEKSRPKEDDRRRKGRDGREMEEGKTP